MKRAFILLGVLTMTGCGTIPTAYHTPPASTSMAERQKIYEEHAITRNWWQKVFGTDDGQFETLASYYETSGDMISASRSRKGDNYSLWALGAFFGGFLISEAMVGGHLFQNGSQNDSATYQTLPVNVLAFGFTSSLFLTAWGYNNNLVGAERSFNAYLKRDLGLPADYQPKPSL